MLANPIINPVSVDADHIHVVAAIIWHREQPERFLIAQRQKGKHLEHYWEFPGGKLEAGETAWQGLQREIAEEVDLQLTGGKPYMQVYFRYPERNVLLDSWIIDEYQGEVRGREQQSIAWIDLSEIENFRFPPADIPILEAIKRSAKAEN